MAARSLMLKLQERGLVVLPARRQAPSNRMRRRQLRPEPTVASRLRATWPALRPLVVQEVSQRSEEQALYEWLLHEYHYLSYTGTVGLNLKYLVRDRRGRPLSCLLFGFGGLEVRPTRPVYRLEFGGAADALASGDQQHAVRTCCRG